MEIQFQKKTVSCCREVFRQTKVFQENAECIVSDIYDDIGRIVWSCAQLNLRSKDITQHGVSITGTADIAVLYLNENREELLCMNFSKEFSVDFDISSINPDMQAHILLSSMGVQARAVNSRKIAVQLTIRADLSCWNEESMPFIDGVDSANEYALQEKKENINCMITTQICEKSFVINEQLSLPADQDMVEQILFSQAKLFYNGCQMIGGKALIKGSAEVSVMCRRENAQKPYCHEQSIPFSLLIDSPDGDCILGQLILQPTAVYVSLSDAINASRVIELELHALAQAGFDRPEALSYLADAYSTRYSLLPTLDTSRLTVARTQQLLSAKSEESLKTERNDAHILCQFADLLSFAGREGKAVASASVCILMQSEDGTISSVQKLLSFEEALPEEHLEIISARLTEIMTELQGETLQLHGTVEFSLEKTESTEVRHLASAELDLNAPYELSSLPSLSVVNSHGRELWPLAKAYHSSVEAIEKLNERFPMREGILLIPRV